MKPYYEKDGITIFCGDCRDVLPTLGKVDLVLTDPPYPKLKGNVKVTFDHGVAKRYDDCETVGTPWGDDISQLTEACELACLGAFVFCSWQSIEMIPELINKKRVALITWFKRNTQPSNHNAPHYQTEFIWAFSHGPGGDWRKIKTHYDIPKLQAGCMATERLVDGNGKAKHPTQKPLKLASELLKVGGKTVLDPFAGSGTTGVAAKLLGRKAILIEIEEKYCEIAVQRLRQGVLDF